MNDAPSAVGKWASDGERSFAKPRLPAAVRSGRNPSQVEDAGGGGKSPVRSEPWGIRHGIFESRTLSENFSQLEKLP